MRINKLIKLFALILIFFICIPSYGQFGQPASKKKSEFKMQKRLYFGGGLGFGMSSYSTSLMIAPVIGYRLTPDVDIGIRLNYTYYHYKDNIYKYSTNNYGAGVFARYYLFFFNDLFLHAEYEALNYERAVDVTINGDVITERDLVSSLFLGGGYRQWIGQNAFVGITVLFNLLDSYDSPYNNPIFRIGVGVGI